MTSATRRHPLRAPPGAHPRAGVAGRLWLGVCLVASLMAGCAGVEVASNVKQVRTIIKEARENGAYRCAPHELALAETHAEFTETELNQGDYFRAREHLEIADRNAREAYRLSPRERCVSGAAAPKAKAEIGDKDGDGIKDDVDKCPREPEDKDGFEDEDGCPDPDNDKDGVLDAADKCPNDAGPPENNGCPKKYEHIVVTEAKIELKQKIFFETNKAVIMPRSFPLLAEIGQAMQARPTMTVRIEGHTDSRGKRPHNMTLSQSRADSVRQFLIGLGVEGSRMDSKGFGPDQPIETNKTAAGREKNRRVEFFITQQ